jgi:Cysteine-rich CWC
MSSKIEIKSDLSLANNAKTKCPRCGADNSCGMVEQSGVKKTADCWCMNVPADIASGRVLGLDRGRLTADDTCYCVSCLKELQQQIV